ncbi:hypothetical protein ABMC89_14215 [Sulfitobacter sp. HNIBRBA3233]|uniref:hypothetical protein n=1 Tax=Sulfitobacter marinivivus TaxID=3158558 RepID=UPI0032DEA589
MKRRRRTVLGAAAGAILGIFALGVMLSPPRVPTVAVIGDRAEELREALGAERREEAPEGATVTFALIDRWESLRHLPDIAELCWRACHERAAGHITITRMRFGATAKTVIFHLPSFDGDIACVAERARLELTSLRGAAPPCRTSVSRMPVYVLPMGLGRTS